MLFNSLEYMMYLPIVFVGYWILPHRFRWPLLLAASYYFYMGWNAKYVILIFLTTLVSYLAAILVEKSENRTVKKLVLASALLICFGVLFFFKYFGFFADNLTRIFAHFAIRLNPVTLNVLLPVGISFYTFQTLGYVIDVYRGNVEAEKNFGIYATFISFFPQLVAGPIERTSNLLPQIKAEHHFYSEKALYGAKLMLWGYFKKLLIADVVAQYVDRVFGNVTAYYGFDFVIATFLFALQIYCDFSGYSDIAIGTSKLLDIDLMTNFKSPYFSASVKEFWSRWHISLSTWFKDYLYIPLGGNRCSRIRHAFNLLITFLVSGLWHGANWTFVIWGGIHGVAQVLENVFRKPLEMLRKRQIGRLLSTLCVFIFCNLAWVFFRAESLTDAVYIIRHMFDGITLPAIYLSSRIGFSSGRIFMMLFCFAILVAYDLAWYWDDAIEMLAKRGRAVQWLIYVLLGVLIVFGSQKGVPAEFVYFQF